MTNDDSYKKGTRSAPPASDATEPETKLRAELSRRLEVTLFNNLRNARGTRTMFASFKHLATWLSLPLARPPYWDLDSLAGWSPATFSGDSRSRGNVAFVGALGVDIDSGGVSGGKLRQSYAGFRAVAHTTRRSSLATPRWRIIVALSRDITAEEYDVVWRHEAVRLQKYGVQIDPSTKDPSRLWFRPSRSAVDDSFSALETTGAPLDVEALLVTSIAEEAVPSRRRAQSKEHVAARAAMPVGSPWIPRPPRAAWRTPNTLLRAWCLLIAVAPAGTRNTSLYTAARQLGRLVACGELGEEEVRTMLTSAAAIANLTGREVSSTIDSGLRAGWIHG
jgi:hypothetical protein